MAFGLAIVGLREPATSEAGEPTDARLLVRCEPNEVADVLAALAKTKVEIWDLRTMQRLVPAAREPASAPAPVTQGPIPPLRDASQVMREILAAVGSSPHVTRMVIKATRATFRVSAASMMEIQQMRKRVASNTWIHARLKQVMSGAVTRMPDGRLQADIRLAFDPSRPEPGTAVPLDKIDLKVIQPATLGSNMQMRYASPLMVDPNRSAGFKTTSREFTFAPATRAAFQRMLTALSAAQPGLVVYELRWEIDAKGSVHKPTIRIGGRAPLRR